MSLREYVTVYHAGFRDEAIATLPPVVEPIAAEIEIISPPANVRFGELFVRIPDIPGGFEGAVIVPLTPTFPIDLPAMWVLAGEREMFPPTGLLSGLSDHIVVLPAFPETVITLPDATWDGNGQAPEVRVVNVTSSTKEIGIKGAIVDGVQQTINDSLTATINTAYGRMHFFSDGANWMRVD